MWFAYTDNFAHWHVLKIEQVKEIIAQNKEKIRVSSLEDYAYEVVVEKETTFSNAMGQESLTRFDQPKKKKPNARNRNKKPRETSNSDGAPKIAIAPNDAPAAKSNPNAKPNNKNPRKPISNTNPKPETTASTEKKRPIIIKKNENPT
jgi:hypothetical protein